MPITFRSDGTPTCDLEKHSTVMKSKENNLKTMFLKSMTTNPP